VTARAPCARGTLSRSRGIRRGAPVGGTRIYFPLRGDDAPRVGARGERSRGFWHDAARTTPCSTLIIESSSPVPDRPANPRETACAFPLACSPANPGGRARRESVMAAMLKVSERRINS